MLTKNIRTIIALVALALAGMLLLQGYWLFTSYHYTSRQFETEVSGLLESLKRDHALTDMRSSGILPADRSQPLKPSDLSLLGFMQTSSSTLSFVQPSGKSVVVKLNSGYQYSPEEFSYLSKSLAAELDSLLKTRDLDADFNYRLLNVKVREQVERIHPAGQNSSESKIFQVKLGLIKPFLVELSFRNQSSLVIKKMWWMLVASLGIITITVLAFMYLFGTIFQQRKLSVVKNDFINNMTHEFKTPLATVSLAVEALKGFDGSKQRVIIQEYLDICQHELKRIGQIIEKVLGFAMIENGKSSLRREPVDLNLLINEILTTMRLQFEQKSAWVNFQPATVAVYCLADNSQLSSVFYNLLDNSLKYAVDPVVIDINFKVGTQYVEIKVCDNGIGIPKAQRKKVFESFYRIPKGNLHQVKGFGLGLSYAAAVVRAHGGAISLESTDLPGTCFHIRLPLDQSTQFS